jgi:excisionase family DNA binding protein
MNDHDDPVTRLLDCLGKEPGASGTLRRKARFYAAIARLKTDPVRAHHVDAIAAEAGINDFASDPGDHASGTPATSTRFRTAGEGAIAERTSEAEALLTPAQVATMLRADPKTISRWAKAGKLTSLRTLGGHRRYRESEVRALLTDILKTRSE